MALRFFNYQKFFVFSFVFFVLLSLLLYLAKDLEVFLCNSFPFIILFVSYLFLLCILVSCLFLKSEEKKEAELKLLRRLKSEEKKEDDFMLIMFFSIYYSFFSVIFFGFGFLVSLGCFLWFFSLYFIVKFFVKLTRKPKGSQA